MRARLLALLGSLLLLPLTVESARAQCAFNAPGKAKGVKLSFVRALQTCSFFTGTFPNTSTSTSGIPGCTPPGPALELVCETFLGCHYESTEFMFGPRGSCSLSMKPQIERACAGGGTADCMDMLIKAKCKDLRDGFGVPISPVYHDGWTLALVLRATIDDPLHGDMTVIDFPLTFEFPAPGSRGSLTLETTLSQRLHEIFGPDADLPACTNLALLTTYIRDPAGLQFAAVGTSTR